MTHLKLSTLAKDTMPMTARNKEVMQVQQSDSDCSSSNSSVFDDNDNHSNFTILTASLHGDEKNKSASQ